MKRSPWFKRFPLLAALSFATVAPPSVAHAAAPDWPGVDPQVAENIQQRTANIMRRVRERFQVSDRKAGCIEFYVRFTVFRYTQVLDTFRPGGGIAYVHMSGKRGPASGNVRLPATGAVRLFDDSKEGETEEKLRQAHAKACANNDGGPGPGSGATWREFEKENPT